MDPGQERALEHRRAPLNAFKYARVASGDREEGPGVNERGGVEKTKGARARGIDS